MSSTRLGQQLAIAKLEEILQNPMDNQKKVTTIGSAIYLLQSLASLGEGEPENYAEIAKGINDPNWGLFFIQQVKKIITVSESSNKDVATQVSHLLTTVKHLQDLTKAVDSSLTNFIRKQLTQTLAPDANEQLSILNEFTPENMARFNSSLTHADFSATFETLYDINEFTTLGTWHTFFVGLSSLKDVIPLEFIKFSDRRDEHLKELIKLTNYIRYFNQHTQNDAPNNPKKLELIKFLYKAIICNTALIPIQDIFPLMSKIADCLDDNKYFAHADFNHFLGSTYVPPSILFQFFNETLRFLITKIDRELGIVSAPVESKKHSRDVIILDSDSDDEKKTSEKRSRTNNDEEKSLFSINSSPSTVMYLSSTASTHTSIAASTTSSSSSMPLTPRRQGPISYFSTAMRTGRLDFDRSAMYKFSYASDKHLDLFLEIILQPEFMNLPSNDPVRVKLLADSKVLYKSMYPAERMCFIEALIDPNSTFTTEIQRRGVTSDQCLAYFVDLIQDSVNTVLNVNAPLPNGRMPDTNYPFQSFYPLIGAINIANKAQCKKVLDKLLLCSADPEKIYRIGNTNYTIAEYAKLGGRKAISLCRDTEADKWPKHHEHTQHLFNQYVKTYKANMTEAKANSSTQIVQLSSLASASSSSNGLFQASTASASGHSSSSSSSRWSSFTTSSSSITSISLSSSSR